MPDRETELETEADILKAEKTTAEPGVLYIVGTPIGNLGDLSPRAAEILAGVDLVAAEDTRRTLRLLTHLGLRKHLESYHEHNWQTKGPFLLEKLKKGHRLALVSDAGMPCISDPGSELVRLCVDNNLPVIVIPGPCAAIVGLAGSGLLTDRFVFEGFLPAAGKSRKERLNILADEERTLVLYEAPHRLKRTLADLESAGFTGRRLTLCRELTKRHEEFLRMTVAGAIDHYNQVDPRGEYVLILEGRGAYSQRCPETESASAGDSDAPENLLKALLDDGMSVKDAVRRCAAETGLKKNEIYQMALDLHKDS